MTRKVAVIAAHPDDEVLGCGATIAKHVAAGDRVHVLLLAEGATSRALNHVKTVCTDEVDALREAARQAGRILGVESVEFAGFPDNRLDGLALLDVVKTVEDFINKHAPEVVYTHHAGDTNVDHGIASRAVATALRPMPGACWSRLLFFEVLSSSEWGASATGRPFVPQWFEEVTAYLDRKLAALEAYATELRAFPHPRSPEGVKALAALRGATVGVMAAEAFMLGWQIQKS